MIIRTIVLIVLALTTTGRTFAQLGATRQEVIQRYGEGKLLDEQETESEVREYSSRMVGGVVNTLTTGGLRAIRVPCSICFAFDNDRVVFAKMGAKVDNVIQAYYFSLDEVDQFLLEVSTGHGHDQRKEHRWQIDPIQTQSTLELGTVADRNLRKWGPVNGIRVTIATHVITDARSGQLLSSSGSVTKSPLYSYVDKPYRTNLGVKRIVLVRDDGRAYCVFDLWFDRSGAEAGVKRVFVADAETHFATLFNQIEQILENPPSSKKWDRNAGMDYMQALANFASEEQLRKLQKIRLLAATICAVDNPNVPLPLVKEQIEKLPKELVYRNLIANSRRIHPEAKQRRDSLIAEIKLP